MSDRCHEQVELALLGSHLGNVDVEVADWIGLELLSSGFIALGPGRRLIPCRWKQRCKDDRVRCGTVACRA
jgi:hypothetical protein